MAADPALLSRKGSTGKKKNNEDKEALTFTGLIADGI